MSKTIAALQAAFDADPIAIQSLVVNRVPCNQKLADDPFVIVDRPATVPGEYWTVGALGLVNAVLAANGLPLVALKFSDTRDAEGRAQLLGFCEYRPLPNSHTAAAESHD